MWLFIPCWDTTCCGSRKLGAPLVRSGVKQMGWVLQPTEGLAERAGISRCSLTSW